MNCRGHNNRLKIVNDYDIKPIAHLKLLAGQEERSAAKADLTDSYYVFAFSHKKNPKDSGTFVCGRGAADDFLQLIGSSPLPLFNPLKLDPGLGPKTGSGTKTAGGQPSATIWDETAKQLYNAICLLFIYWHDASPGPLADIKIKIENYPDNCPSLGQVKAVNTIISKDKSVANTLQDMIALLRTNNDIKRFDFLLLNNMLALNGITSNFG